MQISGSLDTWIGFVALHIPLRNVEGSFRRPSESSSLFSGPLWTWAVLIQTAGLTPCARWIWMQKPFSCKYQTIIMKTFVCNSQPLARSNFKLNLVMTESASRARFFLLLLSSDRSKERNFCSWFQLRSTPRLLVGCAVCSLSGRADSGSAKRRKKLHFN